MPEADSNGVGEDSREAESLKLRPGLSAILAPELKPKLKEYSRSIDDDVLPPEKVVADMNTFLDRLNVQGADIVASFPVLVNQDRREVQRTMLIVRTPQEPK
jgi:hypothetical protein